jgi:hypothetical protein
MDFEINIILLIFGRLRRRLRRKLRRRRRIRLRLRRRNGFVNNSQC